ADVEQPLRPLAEEIADGGPAAIVRHGGEHPGRLVERQVDQTLAAWDAPAIHLDDLVVGIDPRAIPAHDLPIHLDPALADQFLAMPAAADARGGEHLLQAGAPPHVGARNVARNRRPTPLRRETVA